MQIRKNGEIVYNSIDNTGSTDDAALGARYAKGRIDTLEGNFDNYFDKDEVLDLLEQKSAAQFVNQLPATLADNTWYYSKKYADGTDVPNDKRALYAKDALGVTQYLGVVGDVDLTDYQEKQDNTLDTTAKTVVGAINENKDSIDELVLHEDVYNPYFESASCDACVFDFHDNGYASGELKVKSTRQFIAQMVDPISNARVFGYCDTTQYFVSQGATVYIEQRFTQNQGSNVNSRKEFFRKGSVVLDNATDYKNWVSTQASNIVWNAWIPIEYPSQDINVTVSTVTAVGTWAITGGVLCVSLRNVSSTAAIGQNAAVKIVELPSLSYKGTGMLSAMYPLTSSSANIGAAQVLTTSSSIEVLGLSANVRYLSSISIPLGY